MAAHDNRLRSTNGVSYLRCPHCRRALTAGEIIEKHCDECDVSITPETAREN